MTLVILLRRLVIGLVLLLHTSIVAASMRHVLACPSVLLWLVAGSRDEVDDARAIWQQQSSVELPADLIEALFFDDLGALMDEPGFAAHA
eukprot:2870912-Amphidinium_carterae.1